jgi:hypothetical protein
MPKPTFEPLRNPDGSPVTLFGVHIRVLREGDTEILSVLGSELSGLTPRQQSIVIRWCAAYDALGEHRSAIERLSRMIAGPEPRTSPGTLQPTPA